MRVVVADTSPVRYLAEIGQPGLLPRLFGGIFIPAVVYSELQHGSTPPAVRGALESPPSWLQIESVGTLDDPTMAGLDEGEKAAVLPGIRLNAELILIDDRKGAEAARRKELAITGTLGVLALAARHDLVCLADAFARLRRTNFHCPEGLMRRLLSG